MRRAVLITQQLLAGSGGNPATIAAARINSRLLAPAAGAQRLQPLIVLSSPFTTAAAANSNTLVPRTQQRQSAPEIRFEVLRLSVSSAEPQLLDASAAELGVPARDASLFQSNEFCAQPASLLWRGDALFLRLVRSEHFEKQRSITDPLCIRLLH